MDVSVIIINFNTYQLSCNCIQSLIDHTSNIGFEIILVDNASTECNPDLFKKRFPGIILVKSDVNLGFAGGNNLGLKYVSGSNILLLNSDTLLLENSILFIFDKCKNIPRLGVATIQLYYPDGRIQANAKRFPSVLAHFLKTSRLRKIFRKTYNHYNGNYNYSQSFVCDWVWGTFFYFPIQNLKGLNNKLPETYFMYSEDVEWCYHFKQNHLDNYFLNDSKIIHFGGQSSSSDYRNKVIFENHLHFIKSNYGFGSYLIERLLFMIDDLEWRVRFGRSPVV